MTISKSKLQNLLGQILALLPSSDRKQFKSKPQLVCVFVDEKHGRRLNKQFRGRNYATDILSFQSIEPGSFGELVFCEPVLKRQAREHQMTFGDEFLYLFIHGLLHLLGYEHEKSDKEAQRMYRLQDSIFEQLRQDNGSRNRTVRRKK